MVAPRGLKAKHQRLVLVAIAFAALVCAGLLAAWGLRNEANYFYTPSQIVADPPSGDRMVRLGGMVQEGSIEQLGDGISIRFTVSDGEASLPVRFTGIVPDLFVEGSGVVAEGRMGSAAFMADNLLAKHDENYVPRELQDMTEHQAREIVSETTGAGGGGR